MKVDAVDLTDPATFQEFEEAQNQLSGALGRLLAITENYPDLKSNQNFLALQSQLEGTENRIAVARRDYIEAVRPTTPRSGPSRAAGGARCSILMRSPCRTLPSPEETTKVPRGEVLASA